MLRQEDSRVMWKLPPTANDMSTESETETPLPDGQRLFRVTRQTREFVWLRWVAYGTEMRGLSMRVPSEEFRTGWLSVLKKDGLDGQLFFRRTSSQNAEREGPLDSGEEPAASLENVTKYNDLRPIG